MITSLTSSLVGFKTGFNKSTIESQFSARAQQEILSEQKRAKEINETWLDWTSLSRLIKTHPEVSNVGKIIWLLFNLNLFDVEYDSWRRFCEINDSLNSDSSWWYYNWDTWRLYEYNHSNYDAGHIETWNIAEDCAVWRSQLEIWTSVFQMWNWDIVGCVSILPELFWKASTWDVKMADVYVTLKWISRSIWLPFYNTTVPIAVPSQYNEWKTTLEVDIIEPDATRDDFHNRIKTVLNESKIPINERTPWNEWRATRLMRDYMNTIPRQAQKLWWQITEKFLTKDMYKLFWNVQMSMLDRPDWQEWYLITARMSFQDVAFWIVRTPKWIKVTIRMPEKHWYFLWKFLDTVNKDIELIIREKMGLDLQTNV